MNPRRILLLVGPAIPTPHLVSARKDGHHCVYAAPLAHPKKEQAALNTPRAERSALNPCLQILPEAKLSSAVDEADYA